MDEYLKQKLTKSVETFHSDRGRLLNAYAQVEYLALDMFSYLRNYSIYEEMLSKFPNSIKSKLNYMDKVVSEGSPLFEFSNLIHDMKNLLSDNLEIRHYLAHGFSKFLYDKNSQISVQLLRFEPKKTNPWVPSEIVFTFDEFRNTVSMVVRKSDTILRSSRNMYDLLKLQGDQPIGEFRSLSDL